ncbi:DUF3089 domain-containing protein [Flexithrix dorotheae]|uniref:DUF3089 domain-containing protein n=1 Tax=Flexithrix dorotheae TaxID=70993 RepID=UPI00037518FA|nr:DUF3089 domain-containing protein [Flexithrix dorotheae]
MTLKNSTILFVVFLMFKSYSGYGQQQPLTPDYKESQNWIALPQMEDPADVVPSESDFTNNQENAKVDVFYIHPTTALGLLKVKNADLNTKRFNKRSDFVIMNQASVFNGSCKVYAPRYRQVSLGTFLKKQSHKNRTEVFNLAYKDVKNAFEYYLKNYNNGRPIIIAGHSQGSYHGLRLIEEYFEGKPLFKKLVAAYLIGNASAIPEDKFKKSFKDIQPCSSALQTGCIISFNTHGGKIKKKPPFYFRNDLMFYGKYGEKFESNAQKKFVGTNPLTWTMDEAYAHYDLNLGGTKFVRKSKKFKKIDKNVIDGQLENGILRVGKIKKSGYKAFILKDYHVFEYNLYYSNIRKNVAERVDAYFKQHNGAGIGNTR